MPTATSTVATGAPIASSHLVFVSMMIYLATTALMPESPNGIVRSTVERAGLELPDAVVLAVSLDLRRLELVGSGPGAALRDGELRLREEQALHLQALLRGPASRPQQLRPLERVRSDEMLATLGRLVPNQWPRRFHASDCAWPVK